MKRVAVSSSAREREMMTTISHPTFNIYLLYIRSAVTKIINIIVVWMDIWVEEVVSLHGMYNKNMLHEYGR